MSLSIKNLPLSERPRERLEQLGGDYLSCVELIAILIGSGTKSKSAIVLAQELLASFKDLKSLSEATISELLEIKGIGKAKAIQLKSAFALASRMAVSFEPIKYHADCSKEVYSLIKEPMQKETSEVLMILMRNTKGYLYHKEIIAKGTLSQVLIHPREVFYPAIRHKAAGIIIAHNHPSGDATPSSEDISLTKNLHEASKIMGIELLDHLIIGKNSYVSLFEAGLFRKS